MAAAGCGDGDATALWLLQTPAQNFSGVMGLDRNSLPPSRANLFGTSVRSQISHFSFLRNCWCLADQRPSRFHVPIFIPAFCHPPRPSATTLSVNSSQISLRSNRRTNPAGTVSAPPAHRGRTSPWLRFALRARPPAALDCLVPAPVTHDVLLQNLHCRFAAGFVKDLGGLGGEIRA